MIGALLAAVVTSAAASPLPIIITTQSSRICQAFREKVAPAIARIVSEDSLMARQVPVGTTPQHGATISALALNWIKLDELLNPDTFFTSDNATERARMESLREKLQRVADDENNALNVLSGSYYTQAMEELMGTGIGFGKDGKIVRSGPPPQIVKYSGPLEMEYVRREAQTQRAELAIYPELQPLISQCGGAASPAPSPAP